MVYEIKDYANIEKDIKAFIIVSFFFGTVIPGQIDSQEEYVNPFIKE